MTLFCFLALSCPAPSRARKGGLPLSSGGAARPASSPREGAVLSLCRSADAVPVGPSADIAPGTRPGSGPLPALHHCCSPSCLLVLAVFFLGLPGPGRGPALQALPAPWTSVGTTPGPVAGAPCPQGGELGSGHLPVARWPFCVPSLLWHLGAEVGLLLGDICHALLTTAGPLPPVPALWAALFLGGDRQA